MESLFRLDCKTMLKHSQSVLTWRTSIKPALMRSLLLRGSLLAGAGALLLVTAGAFLPTAHLKIWGLPLLIVAFLFITIGLLPYRRLTKLEVQSNELHYDGTSLLFVSKGKPVLRIPAASIAMLCYREEDPHYGLCIQLKTPLPEKVIVLQARFDLKGMLSASRQCMPGCDLFFPYFSERSCNELGECLNPCLDDVMHFDESHHF